MMHAASTTVVIIGLAATAGSRFSDLNSIGRKAPVKVANATTLASEIPTVSPNARVNASPCKIKTPSKPINQRVIPINKPTVISFLTTRNICLRSISPVASPLTIMQFAC